MIFRPFLQSYSSRQGGFTLVEMIMVITITGIIGGMVAVFLKFPAQQYTDVARRAEMTDIADTALRRITRDLRLALPNSVRVTGTCDGASTCFLEFLPVKGSGRYRAGAGGNELDFTAADSSFEVLGPMPAFAADDSLVVYNLGIDEASAYDDPATNRTAWVSNTATTVTFSARKFPFESPGNRFHVISTPVTYTCAPAPGGAGGTLTRWQGYAIQRTQPVTLPAIGSSALLATSISSCRFTYDANIVVSQRYGLVTMHLGITQNGETVTLYSATHVSNQP